MDVIREGPEIAAAERACISFGSADTYRARQRDGRAAHPAMECDAGRLKRRPGDEPGAVAWHPPPPPRRVQWPQEQGCSSVVLALVSALDTNHANRRASGRRAHPARCQGGGVDRRHQHEGRRGRPRPPRPRLESGGDPFSAYAPFPWADPCRASVLPRQPGHHHRAVRGRSGDALAVWYFRGLREPATPPRRGIRERASASPTGVPRPASAPDAATLAGPTPRNSASGRPWLRHASRPAG